VAVPATPADTLNQQRVRQSRSSATFQTIPILYGESVAQGGIFAIGKTSPTRWVFGILWGYGPLTYLRNVRLDDELPIGDFSVTNYLGSMTQEVDPTLARAIINPQYSDNLRGYAYSVVAFDQSDYGSVPNFTAEVGGITGTSNPAVAYRDFVENDVYGLGGEVDSSAQEIAENFNAEYLDQNEIRHQVGLVVNTPLDAESWLDILAEYAGCWSNHQGGKYSLKPNWITPITRNLTANDLIRGGLVAEYLNLSQVPTTVEVQFSELKEGKIESRVAVYRTQSVLRGEENERISRITMPGIIRYSEAYRYARTRQQLLNNREWKLIGLDSLLDITRGDRITYTDDSHALDLHVAGVPTRSATGLVELDCYEYRASDYSSEVVSTPTFSSGKLVYE